MDTTPTPRPFDLAEMESMLPVIVSDLKHAEPGRRAPINQNVWAAMYNHVVREMFEKDRFFCEEPVGSQMGLFIKGHVRDVWAYLQDAYKLIHETDFEAKYAKVLEPAWGHAGRVEYDETARMILVNLARRLRAARRVARKKEGRPACVNDRNAGAENEAWNSYQAAKALLACRVRNPRA
ncbi:hypothetical protein ABIC83_002983 [Roseateles asaccharophilus]|uniref:hypothetical protein n=1 Tax=Roseateles asaccharophilus TaxID=582607 RepID=UPI003834EC9D